MLYYIKLYIIDIIFNIMKYMALVLTTSILYLCIRISFFRIITFWRIVTLIAYLYFQRETS